MTGRVVSRRNEDSPTPNHKRVRGLTDEELTRINAWRDDRRPVSVPGPSNLPHVGPAGALRPTPRQPLARLRELIRRGRSEAS